MTDIAFEYIKADSIFF